MPYTVYGIINDNFIDVASKFCLTSSSCLLFISISKTGNYPVIPLSLVITPSVCRQLTLCTRACKSIWIQTKANALFSTGAFPIQYGIIGLSLLRLNAYGWRVFGRCFHLLRRFVTILFNILICHRFKSWLRGKRKYLKSILKGIAKNPAYLLL